MNKFTEKIKIITNNPLVQAKYPETAKFLESGAEEVLIAVRDSVHLGAAILNHPLSGDILPGVCPYKSLIVTDADGSGSFHTDFESLALVENALRAVRKAPEGFKGYDEKTLEDFRVIDLDLLESALL